VSPCSPAIVGSENASEDTDKWLLALQRLTEALKLLDEGNAPPEIGAELDLTMHRLRTAIERATQRES
jgi:hypothetical protein